MSFHSNVAWAGLIILAAACSSEAGTPTGPELSEASALTTATNGSKSQQSDLIMFSDFITVGGVGSLTRTPQGVNTHITVNAGAIPAGDVVTLWAAIFNNPGECAIDPCDFPDIENPAVEGSLVWLGSGIAGKGATLYTGQVMVGDASGDILDLFGLPNGPGLLNAAGAEIHVVVRTHGPKINGELQSQRKSFLGPNCTTDPEPNPDPCDDLAFAMFQAP